MRFVAVLLVMIIGNRFFNLRRRNYDVTKEIRGACTLDVIKMGKLGVFHDSDTFNTIK